MLLLQQLQQAHADEQREETITTVGGMHGRVSKEGSTRGIFRLNGKTAFSLGVHLNMINACPSSDFSSASATLRTLTHATQQRFILRVTVWSGNIDDARFVAGNLLQLRSIEKVDIWNGILCGASHRDDIDLLDEAQALALGIPDGPQPNP
ncbi:hypothetical protein PR003_g12667 [Phytophthora rubi]|uniref:Uncharacterized protein n=1 Tax=Phytophthora rubi TaxID=129364 RepID=A0A6A4F8I3_9STRA|nr:hypothetical protein PR002_g11393 [Phytophthora rubi]KAE9336114.1 hypothetical protein PR003_g12667 [Phytophthora rubi]